MNRTILCIAASIIVLSALNAQEEPKLPPISIDELNRRPVMGKLEIPLGTVVDVDAVIVSGKELRRKALDGTYLLKITHVNGTLLNEPPVMPFSVPEFVSTKLASHTFALYEMKNGAVATRLDSSQIRELEKDYVGKSVRLAVYEVGSFHGIPNLPDDLPVWQDVGFHFSTSLTVLAERDRKP